jgi:hypothetical protein
MQQEEQHRRSASEWKARNSPEKFARKGLRLRCKLQPNVCQTYDWTPVP